jgi:nitrilase
MEDFPNYFLPFEPSSHDCQPHSSQWTPEAILNHGGSCVFGPMGTFLADPVWDEETILYADLQRQDLIEFGACMNNVAMKLLPRVDEF